ncbi:GTP-binding protein [Idiomarina sp. WRN-38]|uniref:ribosome biogenesis GTP-binding protein YihA/YsxC n=2 Tax=unclassified Idiomarina TaxID=2614829 RepID=UPI0007339214|nr:MULTISPECIES: ribosome biogenesis GTP-binding protein YihA/YsxC [unclassified Idiomarina]KTG28760.1 GTP-binding protein [Idiomarina sp. H105]OAF09525.1 GTP-binding protein [Idiomarina sp. WRN-38]MCJ8317243.1 ribosome biogenesis GTP-binding protein YihA/YsxC [Idiomarina sp.]NQZ16856.1 YihA family ribosome biogenesis GTP-binding protein [Idiomarina sp.]WPZ01399.1 ribosome biogenesis GTP-binding protein YihA/YsxC [Idiomarina sp. OXR-189]
MSMKPLNYASASFVTSAPDITKLPPDTGIEIAFAGRSNAGKSSALNTLTRQKSLARTSKTPGRTQLINVFELDSGERLIDLPGYGFAKVPMAVKEKWQKALAEYLQKRDSLKGIVVLMDIRHPFRETDQELIYWAADCGIPVLALLTKADKLKQGPRKSTVLQARQAAIAFNGDVQVEAFSSLKRIGVEQLENKLNEWFGSQDDG